MSLPISQLPSKHKSWIDQLDEAVTTADEPRIWQLMDQFAGDDSAHETLANMISRSEYIHQSTTVYCELFMVPIITAHDCNVIGNQSAWAGVRNQVRDSIGSWFNDAARMTLFDDIAPMDWVTTWPPGVLRAHLERLSPYARKTKVVFETQDIALPPSAPRLGFIVIGRSTEKGWRDLPTANSLMDQRFKEIVKYCFQIQAPSAPGQMAPVPTVLTPERVQFAVTDGISLWLSKLHEAVGIVGWTVMPSLKVRDVVKITLQLQDSSVPYTQFTIRLHQIGSQGLHDVLSILEYLAPLLDAPSNSRTTRDEEVARETIDN